MTRQAEETAEADTVAEVNGWATFPMQEFVEEGLLHLINREVLWPAGLALTLRVRRPIGSVGPPYDDVQWDSGHLVVTQAQPIEKIVTGRDDAEDLYRRARAYLAERRGKAL